MSQIAENLRYLLWRNKVERSSWVSQLATWIEGSERRAEELLKQGNLQPTERERIAQTVNRTDEELQFGRLIETDGVDILLQNVQYLLDTLEHGEQTQLAKSIGMSSTSISRWHRSIQRPDKTAQIGLCKYFGLPPDVDLETKPIFLTLSPLTDRQRRIWLRERINKVSATKLQALFPALELLLKD